MAWDWLDDLKRKTNNVLTDVSGGITDAATGAYEFVGDVKDNLTGETAKDAANDAIESQEEAAKNAAEVMKHMYDTSRADTQLRRDMGDAAMLRMAGRVGKEDREDFTYPGFDFNPDDYAYNAPDPYNAPTAPEFEDYQAPTAPGAFSFDYSDFEKTPFYDFLQDSAARQVERSAAARGGLNSGGTMAALQDRAQQIAGAEYGNQYNRAADTYKTNYGAYEDQRDFGRNVYTGDRAFDYGQYLDDRTLGADQYNKDRLFGYGQHVDDRNMGYQTAMDKYNAGRQSSNDSYSRLMGLIQGSQPAFEGSLQNNMNYGSQMGNIYGNLANAQGAAAMGSAQMQQQALNNMLGLGMLGYGIFSDKRLKKDIEKVGTWKNYNIYKYRYLWSPLLHFGVMADEVKEVNPEAVIMDESGFMKVDYGRL